MLGSILGGITSETNLEGHALSISWWEDENWIAEGWWWEEGGSNQSIAKNQEGSGRRAEGKADRRVDEEAVDLVRGLVGNTFNINTSLR